MPWPASAVPDCQNTHLHATAKKARAAFSRPETNSFFHRASPPLFTRTRESHAKRAQCRTAGASASFRRSRDFQHTRGAFSASRHRRFFHRASPPLFTRARESHAQRTQCRTANASASFAAAVTSNTRAGLFLRPETDASLPRFPAAFYTSAGKPCTAYAMPHRRRVRIVRRGSDFQHTRGAFSASRIAAREKSLHSPRIFVHLTSGFAVQAVPPRSSAATKYPQAAPPNRRRASRPAP